MSDVGVAFCVGVRAWLWGSFFVQGLDVRGQDLRVDSAPGPSLLLRKSEKTLAKVLFF